MKETYKVKVINSTTRPGRKGAPIGAWITALAAQNERLSVEFLDLGEVNLPLMDEANHPRLKQYQHEHTKKWSAKIEEADAFIFVLAEYNHSHPAPIKNALDYLFQEWAYKPAGIVSYGGISGGTRSAHSLKGTLGVLKIVPLPEAVNLPFFTHHINEKGEFAPDHAIIHAAQTMFAEMIKWTEALKPLRERAK